MPTTTTITRRELAEHLRETFAVLGIVDRHDVLRALEHGQAPQEAIELVAERVPEGVRLVELRDLWEYLPDVPVDRSP